MLPQKEQTDDGKNLKMRVGSLFSGIGGIELGLERAGGFETRWFVECEPYAQEILRKHWPQAPIYDDVKTIDFTKLQQVDMLTGGFPCQDISNAGRRAGIQGERSGLWKYYLRAIREIRPKIALIENVSALTIRGLGVVLGDLAQEGYDAEWFDLRASDVGAPHRRERIFIVAYPKSIRIQGLRTCGEQKPSVDEGLFMCEGQGTNVAYSGSNLQGNENIGRNDKTSNRSSGYGEIKTDVSNSNFGRLERANTQRWFCTDVIRNIAKTSEWWTIEPNLGRVAYGIPFRVDRIKCLGNAVVPQCSEIIGKAIQERFKDTK